MRDPQPTSLRTGKNRYLRRAKISEVKFDEFLGYFASDMDATRIAALTHLNRNTVNRLTGALRERIAEASLNEIIQEGLRPDAGLSSETGRLFHPHGFKSTSAISVIGWLGPTGKVRVEVTQNAPAHPASERSAPRPARPPGISSTGITTTTGGGLLDEFWAFTGTRLIKFKGISRNTYRLHLKECEFRFNNRDHDLYRLLLEIVARRPLF